MNLRVLSAFAKGVGIDLEDVSVELAELVLEGLPLRQHALLVSEQPVLAHAHQLHFVGQTEDLVQFALAAVLRRHLQKNPKN